MVVVDEVGEFVQSVVCAEHAMIAITHRMMMSNALMCFMMCLPKKPELMKYN